MAYGKLGTVVTTANTNHTVYTVPSNCLYAEISINILNRDTTDSIVKLAIGSSATPDAQDYIEDGAIVPGSGGVLERDSLIAGPGELIVVNTSASGSVVRVSGKEITKN